MTASYDKNSAVVVLPPVGGGRLQSAALRRWLAKADLQRDDEPRELLAIILAELGLPYPPEGLAALRIWGQTGDRPGAWIAAADPVYLEPRLDHLCLHALRPRDVPSTDLGPLFNHLQQTLADGTDYGFARLGTRGYLRCRNPLATAHVPPYVIDGGIPDDHVPRGEGADASRKLISEVEMVLHEHEVNRRREADGLPPVNSLWLWGGGRAPEKMTRPQPPLFADDPLLTGYWESATAASDAWPGSIEACIEASVAGFVAVVPEGPEEGDVLESCLEELRTALRARRLSRLVLLFGDRVRAEIRRSQALRFWRRDSVLLV